MLFPQWPCSAVRDYRSTAILLRSPELRQLIQSNAGSTNHNARFCCNAQCIGILLRFTWLNEFQLYSILGRPGSYCVADVFRAMSQRIRFGLPRHSIRWFSVRLTRSAGMEKSTSIPSPSRLQSSSIFNSRNLRPSPS